MGLLKAGIGALSGALADQWREYFYCEALDAQTLVKRVKSARPPVLPTPRAATTSFPTAPSWPWPTVSA